jgi:[protein-PII] uridylyltransferase
MNQSLNYQFGVDFSTAGEIATDPRKRHNFFKAFKTLIAEERGKIRKWHRREVVGREVLQAHTGLIDEALKHIILSLSKLDTYNKYDPLSEFALVAVGGYGRGELNPNSDIDLLFLRPKSILKITDQFIQDVTSIFWGIGLEIGQSCRTIKDCIKLAEEDVTIKTSMIDTRYLIGDLYRYEQFRRSFKSNILGKSVKGFIQSKLLESSAVESCNMEPNIKTGPGGLRDYHSALWMVSARYGSASLREIRSNDVVSSKELDALDTSLNFLFRVRNELHYQTGKKADVLTIALQKKLAKNLGYTGKGRHAVQSFMHDFYLHTGYIKKISESIIQQCLAPKQSLGRALANLTRKSLGRGFHGHGKLLSYDSYRGETFKKNKSLLITALNLCLKHDMEPDSALKRNLHLFSDLLDNATIQQKRTETLLKTTLKHQNSEKYLRIMHEAGILGRILPDFGRSICMVNYDFYHHFTADEHSLRKVAFLEELGSASIKDRKLLVQMYKKLKDSQTLKLSFLLQFSWQEQPVACPEESDYLSHLALSVEEMATLKFLLSNQHEMIETALHQDIHQPTVVKRFAEKIGSSTQLQLLFLFSYSELRAVAPGAWTSYKEVLMSELYHRTLAYIKDPESLSQRPQATRDEVYRVLQLEYSATEIEGHLRKMPKDYLISYDSVEVAQHIRACASLKGKSFALNRKASPIGNFQYLTLSCQSPDQAFENIVGVLTTKNLNILGAKILSQKNGLTIVTVQVEDPRPESTDAKMWEILSRDLDDIFSDRKKLAELLKTRTRFVAEKSSTVGIVPKITIDNQSVTNYTIVRVEARDHIGMLYKVVHSFGIFNIVIHRTIIASEGGRGIDVFHVTHLNGKITKVPFLRRIKENMIRSLLTENLENLPQ